MTNSKFRAGGVAARGPHLVCIVTNSKSRAGGVSHVAPPANHHMDHTRGLALASVSTAAAKYMFAHLVITYDHE